MKQKIKYDNLLGVKERANRKRAVSSSWGGAAAVQDRKYRPACGHMFNTGWVGADCGGADGDADKRGGI